MATITIDIDEPFPSPDSIRDPIMEAATGCPNLTLPEIPTLPSPVFPTMYPPSIEGMMASAELAVQTALDSCAAIYEQLSNVPIIGNIIDTFFPDLPVLGINLADLMLGNVDTQEILQIIKDNLPDIAKYYDFITLPWSPTVNIPDIDVLQIWQSITAQAYSMIMKAIGGFVTFIFQVASIFGDTIEDLIGMFWSAWAPILNLINSLPPTFEDIMFAIKDFFDLPGVNVQEIYAALLAAVREKILTVKEVMAAVSAFFIGIPGLIQLPEPLIPDVTMPTFDLREAFKNLYSNFPQYVMQQVWDFLDPFLSIVFGLGLPSISVSYPISCDALAGALPKTFVEDIPTIPDVPDIPTFP